MAHSLSRTRKKEAELEAWEREVRQKITRTRELMGKERRRDEEREELETLPRKLLLLWMNCPYPDKEGSNQVRDELRTLILEIGVPSDLNRGKKRD